MLNQNTSPTPLLPAKSSAGRKFVPLLVGLVLLVGAGLGGYRYWTLTPQYSLWQAQRAVADHDFHRFERYVNIDSCAEGVIDDVMVDAMQVAAKSSKVPENLQSKVSELVGGAAAKGVIGLIKPTLIDLLRRQIREYIEKGSVEKARDAEKLGLSVKDLETKAREQDVKFGGIQYVRREGAIAYTGLAFTNEKDASKSFTIELKMQQTDDGWQVTRWNNAAEIFRKFVPVPKTVPDIIPELK